MSAATTIGPVCWRVVAGPESLLYYTQDRRSTIAMWTADRSGRMQRGDIVLMYGTKRLQSYLAVARVCCEPVQNDHAQRFKKNRQWWTYMQVQPLRSEIARAAVESQPFAQDAGCGLKTPAGSRVNVVSPTAQDGFVALLLKHDPKTAKRVNKWLAGRGRYPRALDLEELRWADWTRPATSSPEELKLSRRIAEQLVKTRHFRYLTAEDVDVPRVVQDAADLSLEHPIRDLAGRGRVDILLVDLRRSTPTLLAIEVKIRASLAPGRNPIPQIVRYGAVLTADYDGTWAIETLLVAEHFHDAVIDEASQKGLDWRVCSRRTGRLQRPL